MIKKLIAKIVQTEDDENKIERRLSKLESALGFSQSSNSNSSSESTVPLQMDSD